MSNLEDQQAESQLLGIMKKNFEEEPEDDGTNKFPQNFHPLNSEPFNNNINQDNTLNKNKQDSEPNYDDKIRVKEIKEWIKPIKVQEAYAELLQGLTETMGYL